MFGIEHSRREAPSGAGHPAAGQAAARLVNARSTPAARPVSGRRCGEAPNNVLGGRGLSQAALVTSRRHEPRGGFLFQLGRPNIQSFSKTLQTRPILKTKAGGLASSVSRVASNGSSFVFKLELLFHRLTLLYEV
jgi:hypothetical protein